MTLGIIISNFNIIFAEFYFFKLENNFEIIVLTETYKA